MNSENENSDIRLGFVLFENEEMYWNDFIKNLQNDWDIEITDKPEGNSLVFETNNMIAACGFMPAPVQNDEAVENAKNNFIWPEAVEQTKKHKTHLIVSVMKSEDPLAQGILYTMVASSALKLKNALAIYQWPTVLDPEYFIQMAEMIKQEQLPIMNLVYFGLYPDEKSFSGYTLGLNHFNKKEIEVLQTNASPEKLYTFLINIATYIIENDVDLFAGETIGFSEEEKLPIKISEGVAVQGESIKIGLE